MLELLPQMRAAMPDGPRRLRWMPPPPPGPTGQPEEETFVDGAIERDHDRRSMRASQLRAPRISGLPQEAMVRLRARPRWIAVNFLSCIRAPNRRTGV